MMFERGVFEFGMKWENEPEIKSKLMIRSQCQSLYNFAIQLFLGCCFLTAIDNLLYYGGGGQNITQTSTIGNFGRLAPSLQEDATLGSWNMEQIWKVRLVVADRGEAFGCVCGERRRRKEERQIP